MKLYRKVENCGPVAHPDQSGKYLTDLNETVSGDGWADLVGLGFVYEVAESVPAQSATPKVGPLLKAALDQPVESEPMIFTPGFVSGPPLTLEELTRLPADLSAPMDATEAAFAATRERKPEKRKAKLSDPEAK